MKSKNKTIRFSDKLSIWHYDENDIINSDKNIPRDNYIVKSDKNMPRDNYIVNSDKNIHRKNTRDSTCIYHFILWFILFLIIYKCVFGYI